MRMSTTHRSALVIIAAALAAVTAALPGGAAPVAWHPATTVDAVPFINGAICVPTTPGGTNNRGVFTDQTLPGMTHIEAYLVWNMLEPRRDEWDMTEFDEMLGLATKYGLKMLVLPCITTPPDWFKQTVDYVPEADAASGTSVDVMSPWAPGTYAAYDHFYAYLSRAYPGKIDIVKFPIEIGMLAGVAPGTLLGPGYHYLCGDRYARADFRDRMLARYGALARLNAAWGTKLTSAAQISYPEESTRAARERQWVDFIAWYQDSAVRAMVRQLAIIRKHFPGKLIDIPFGYGCDLQSDGCDRTAAIRAAAAFAPVDIRSTHGSFNRNPQPQAYWFYKRMAPTAHRLGLGFGTEPPGGDLTYTEIRRQLFEDASAGANFIFHYYQNFHLTPKPGEEPHIIADYKRALRPFEKSLVDIGILYPTTQAMLDLTPHPDGQLQFCAEGRSHLDFDLVDENMIRWGTLKEYKVLVHTSGTVFGDGVLPSLAGWIARGGVLVTHGRPDWQEIARAPGPTAPWLRNEDTATGARLAGKGIAGVRVFRLGKGTVYTIDAAPVSDYLKEVVGVLSSLPTPLHGFKATDDATWMTEFPDGRLCYDVKTQETMFVPAK